MTAFPFRLDEKIIDVIRQDIFTVSAEVIPPRNGAEQAKVLGQIQTLVGAGAQFLSVTKGAGGSLRGGSLPIAQVIKESFNVPCIAHFTCRDLVPTEVENLLMDHHYFGIRNILALRGDPPRGQEEWKPREGGYSYAYQLIEQIRKLNAGEYLPRPGGPEPEDQIKTDFCIGAAAYPEHPDPEERFRFFDLKVKAGAEYGITDMLFDPEVYSRFLDLLGKRRCDVPILPGTRVLRDRAQAERMAKRFRATVPKWMHEALAESKNDPDALKRGVDVFLRLADELERAGAPGVHVYVISDTEAAAQSIQTLLQ